MPDNFIVSLVSMARSGAWAAKYRNDTVTESLLNTLADALEKRDAHREMLLRNGKIVLAQRNAYRDAIEVELARHTEKHGSVPRFAPDDYHAEGEPTHWESYVICNACGTNYPCTTRQNLSGVMNDDES